MPSSARCQQVPVLALGVCGCLNSAFLDISRQVAPLTIRAVRKWLAPSGPLLFSCPSCISWFILPLPSRLDRGHGRPARDRPRAHAHAQGHSGRSGFEKLATAGRMGHEWGSRNGVARGWIGDGIKDTITGAGARAKRPVGRFFDAGSLHAGGKIG